MKCLVYKWSAYNYTDVMMALTANDVECDVIEKKLVTYEVDEEFSDMLSRILQEDEYDFVFSINYFPVIAEVTKECDKPYVFWNCDSPLLSMQHESIFYDTNFGFTFDKSNVIEMREMGVEHFWHMPLGINSGRMKEKLGTMPAPGSVKYVDEVSFVGSLYEKNSYDSLEESLPDYLRGYLDACIEAQCNVTGGNIFTRLLNSEVLALIEDNFEFEKGEGSFANLQSVFANTVLGFKAAQVMRKKYLRTLSKYFKVSNYTESNTSDMPMVIHKPPVNYREEMPVVFRESKINLNFTIPNIQTGLPLRVWDILAAGGFLLTNHQLEVDDYFEDGVDLVCYEDEIDLINKVNYYLIHDKEREEIARNGYNKVHGLHDNTNRVKKMLEIAGLEEL